MNIKITPSALGGTVAAVPSKSMAHRLLISAALSDRPTMVRCGGTSDDIDATVRCLTALGASINASDGLYSVTPIPRPVAGSQTLEVGESGSTLRFMLPVAGALGAEASFALKGRLPSRPLSPLYEELVAHGCAISPQGSNPLQIQGQLTGGTFSIRGDVSSQFVSGLLFALPLLPGGGEIRITGTLESKPYVNMTIAALAEFGIAVSEANAHSSYMIPSGQAYTSPGTVNVEGDWSNAAFWLCAGALATAQCAGAIATAQCTGALGSETITVTNLNASSLQGDKGILALLERFGAHVSRGDNSVTVSPGTLHGINIDSGDIPDLVPVLAAVAAVAAGETVITNAGRLRLKESNRLKTVTGMLRTLGADIAETADGLVIRGRPQLDGGTVDACGDHRIAMTAAVAALACRSAVTIRNAEAVNKSYPGFFKDFAALGGAAEEVN